MTTPINNLFLGYAYLPSFAARRSQKRYAEVLDADFIPAKKMTPKEHKKAAKNFLAVGLASLGLSLTIHAKSKGWDVDEDTVAKGVSFVNYVVSSKLATHFYSRYRQTKKRQTR